MFITFEGIDGSGKSTQMGFCRDVLQAAGHETLLTRNPGGTELGQGLRQILLHHPGYVSPTCELLLYIADRAQHMDEVVLPALEAGKFVLCDRHLDSTVAYQGYGRDLDRAMIDRLNAIATHGRKPELTLLFHGPPEKLLERVSRRGKADRLEREELDFYEKVADGYLALAEAEPERFAVLDALQPIDTLHREIIAVLNDRLGVSLTAKTQG